MPFEQIGENLNDTLHGFNELVNGPRAKAVAGLAASDAGGRAGPAEAAGRRLAPALQAACRLLRRNLQGR